MKQESELTIEEVGLAVEELLSRPVVLVPPSADAQVRRDVRAAEDLEWMESLPGLLQAVELP